MIMCVYTKIFNIIFVMNLYEFKIIHFNHRIQVWKLNIFSCMLCVCVWKVNMWIHTHHNVKYNIGDWGDWYCYIHPCWRVGGVRLWKILGTTKINHMTSFFFKLKPFFSSPCFTWQPFVVVSIKFPPSLPCFISSRRVCMGECYMLFYIEQGFVWVWVVPLQRHKMQNT